ncbi:MAG TPA: substrate-binding domain-containing protein [Burkholderiales bacterium]|nr:substrate-binding domain-containing protein [Burkholderiales bacterium]
MAGTELKILSAGAVKRGVSRIATEFERTTGTRVAVQFSTAPELRKRMTGGESADVIVAPPAVMDDIAQQGKLLTDTRAFLGRSRMGVVVHADAAPPDVRDTAAFNTVLEGATAVVYNRASSGVYAARLLEKLGLAEKLKSRIVVVDTGGAVMEYVGGHAPGAVGLAQISEVMVLIDKGCAVKLAAPLPDEIQNVTSYDAAATAASAAQDAARALARALTSSEAKQVFAATGIS